MKNLIIWSLPILFLTIGCKKDNESEPTNPLNGKTTAVFNSSKQYGTMKDIDGNVYKTITIGTQTWMAENLRVTKYRNGDPIPEVKDNTAWSNLTAGAFCNYKNTQNSDTIATYGRLYNWHTVNDSRLVAPKGWHVPTDEEWSLLTEFLGNSSSAGAALKESGSNHWYNPNTGATNESGFTGLPSGYRYTSGGTFSSMGFENNWWTSTSFSAGDVYYRVLSNANSNIFRNHFIFITNGMAIRCVKD